MKDPTHDEIARRAHGLWKDRGYPDGLKNEIWLEAERELRDEFTTRVQAEAAAESRDEFNLPSTMSDQQAIQAAVQKPAPRPDKSVRSFTGSVKGGSGQSGLG